VVFSFDALFGLTWHMLTPCLTTNQLPQASMIIWFLMLHACLCTICFVFSYTLWRFYAFSGTNLLMRCHSVSSLFSVVFVF
jgi:hypothetical protein